MPFRSSKTLGRNGTGSKASLLFSFPGMLNSLYNFDSYIFVQNLPNTCKICFVFLNQVLFFFQRFTAWCFSNKMTSKTTFELPKARRCMNPGTDYRPQSTFHYESSFTHLIPDLPLCSKQEKSRIQTHLASGSYSENRYSPGMPHLLRTLNHLMCFCCFFSLTVHSLKAGWPGHMYFLPLLMILGIVSTA